MQTFFFNAKFYSSVKTKIVLDIFLRVRRQNLMTKVPTGESGLVLSFIYFLKKKKLAKV